MEIKYPIFLKDRDDCMYLLKNSNDVNNQLENIDIEDKEYVSWDVTGLPLEFYLEDNEIKVKIISDKPQLDKLKESILKYTEVARRGKSFSYSELEDVVELFNAVEKHIQEGKTFHKIKKFFGKK